MAIIFCDAEGCGDRAVWVHRVVTQSQDGKHRKMFVLHTCGECKQEVDGVNIVAHSVVPLHKYKKPKR